MSLNPKHKLQLLKDLLQNQKDEHYMSLDEAAQIDRLVSTLSTDPSLQPDTQEIIAQIRLSHEINTQPFQQNDVEHWVNMISLE